jgi:hypothetical protein
MPNSSLIVSHSFKNDCAILFVALELFMPCRYPKRTFCRVKLELVPI